MKDMSTGTHRVFGAGFMLAMLLAAFASFAQDTAEEMDELMPAVDTSAVTDDEDETATAQDITRTTTGNRVMDSMELGRTEITGNQELPKVLYIVPWKKSEPGDLMGRPVNTLLDDSTRCSHRSTGKNSYARSSITATCMVTTTSSCSRGADLGLQESSNLF
jgi:hypothetical protein